MSALSVMRHTTTVLHGLADDADATEADDLRSRADALFAVRAAVAELIEAASAFATFNSSEPTITVRTPDVTRLRAALACVHGGAA